MPGFTRENTSAATYSSDGNTITYPSFSSWERDSISQGMFWNLGKDWSMKIGATGNEIAFNYDNTPLIRFDNTGTLYAKAWSLTSTVSFPNEIGGTLANINGTLYYNDSV